MNKIEFIGIAASLFILASMCFKTSSFKQAMMMRCVNIIGSAIFVAYGFMLPAYSTAIMNACLVVVNIYHIGILLKERGSR